MTLDEFLAEMEKLERKWWLLVGGIYLRYRSQITCPITAVCLAKTGQYYPGSQYPAAADDIKLPRTLAAKITYAADNEDGELREALLEAAGL